MTDEELKQIIKENKQLLEGIDERMKRIEKKFVWNSIFGFIKVLFILAPLIIAAFYLTPILRDYIKIFDPIFRNLPITLQNIGNNDNSAIPVSGEADLMIESFCDPQTRQGIIDQFCK